MRQSGRARAAATIWRPRHWPVCPALPHERWCFTALSFEQALLALGFRLETGEGSVLARSCRLSVSGPSGSDNHWQIPAEAEPSAERLGGPLPIADRL